MYGADCITISKICLTLLKCYYPGYRSNHSVVILETKVNTQVCSRGNGLLKSCLKNIHFGR